MVLGAVVVMIIYGSWIYTHRCIHCPSSLTSWVRIPPRRGVLDTALCDKFVSYLRRVGGFFRVLRFPPPIKLVFVASPLGTQHWWVWSKASCLGIRIMCPTCLPTDCCYSEPALKILLVVLV